MRARNRRNEYGKREEGVVEGSKGDAVRETRRDEAGGRRDAVNGRERNEEYLKRENKKK